MKSSFTFIDLFAGIGGFHRALTTLEEFKGECVLTCEIDDDCRRVYEANFAKPPKFPKNIRSLTRRKINKPNSRLKPHEIRDNVPEHDVLCAGFPCQPFSKSGKQHGEKDKTRGTLFYDIMEIVRARQPKYLILENVRNLSGPKHVDTLKTIITSIRDAGYSVLDGTETIILSPHVLPRTNKDGKQGDGAPQVRERVFILAIRGKNKKNKSKLESIFKEVQAYKNLEKGWNPDKWDLCDIVKRGPTDITKYEVSKSEAKWLKAWDDFVKVIPSDSLPGFPIWVEVFRGELRPSRSFPKWKNNFIKKNSDFYFTYRSVIDDWMKKHEVASFPPSRQKFEWQARKRHPKQIGRTIRNLVIQMRPSGIRVKPANYLPALVAITQTSIIGPDVIPGENKDYRTITPAEAALLQGMPADTFNRGGLKLPDSIAYKQLGNAVNVGVVRFLAKRLLSGF
jgi:DNA (cytosine-5)-methyltransferase 1